jgi:hypothetical protein
VTQVAVALNTVSTAAVAHYCRHLTNGSDYEKLRPVSRATADIDLLQLIEQRGFLEQEVNADRQGARSIRQPIPKTPSIFSRKRLTVIYQQRRFAAMRGSSLQVGTLREGECILYVDAKVAHGAIEFGVAE